MDALTPAERRGAIVVVLLLALGTAHDLWRASRPLPTPMDRRGVGPVTVDAWLREPGRGDADGARDLRDGRAAATPSGTTSVDLNRATAADLDALPGVGPVLAGRIIAHRERHGPFRDAEELLAVRGIGPRLFARLRPWIMVSGRPPGVPTPAPTPDTVARARCAAAAAKVSVRIANRSAGGLHACRFRFSPRPARPDNPTGPDARAF